MTTGQRKPPGDKPTRSSSRCFYFRFDAYPDPGGSLFETCCGSVASCWCRKDEETRTTEAAYEFATEFLSKEGWSIARVLETVTVGPARYSEPGPGFVEFRDALEVGFAVRFYVRRREVIEALGGSDADEVRTLKKLHAFIEQVRSGGAVGLKPNGGTWAAKVTPDGDEFLPLWSSIAAAPSDAGQPFPREPRTVVPIAELVKDLLPYAIRENMWIGCGIDGALVTTHPTLILRQLAAE